MRWFVDAACTLKAVIMSPRSSDLALFISITTHSDLTLIIAD